MTNRPKITAPVAVRPAARSIVKEGTFAKWSPEIRSSHDSDGATISILDVIGKDFWGDGVTAKRIEGALRTIGNKPVTVAINSPGGDVFEGLAIYNLLREHPDKVTVKILGIAASAASVIAMAGDEVQIGRAAFLMIHNAWVCACGDRNDFGELIDFLAPFDGAMADIYEERSGQPRADIERMMDRETYISGQQAVDLGFADDLLARDAIDRRRDGSDAKSMRAERQFDMLAAIAGLSRSAGRDLLASLKGGKPGAAPTGMQDAADLEQGLSGLLQDLNSIREG